MEWEKPYLEALIDALKPFGEVLQVGFEHGYAADRIQAFRPKSHTIIETNQETAKRAKEWSKKHPHSTVIQEPWQKVLKTLGEFDAVFFDDPFLRDSALAVQREQCAEGALFLRKGKEFLTSVKSQIPQVMTVHYSDQDIDDFYHKAGKFHPQNLPRFFAELKSNGQISKEQYEASLLKYGIEKVEPVSQHAAIAPEDLVFDFIQECLSKHLRKHGRLAWFSNDRVSRYEDPRFSKSIITNPNLDFQERSIPVHPPKSCDYFKGKEGLISVIEKLA